MAAATTTAAAPAAHPTVFLLSYSRGPLSSTRRSLHLPIATTTTAKRLTSFPTHHHNHLSSSSFPLSPPHLLKLLTPSSPKKLLSSFNAIVNDESSSAAVASTFHGPCYVVGDNIDTDQIIPAEHLTLVPSKPDEYRKLGSFALIGLPSASYPIPFVDPDSLTTRFPIIVAGDNFGCGSSREHAPVALGAAGVRAVVAESYARIFFRNSVATGEVYPVESEDAGLCRECSTGDIITVDLAENVLTNHTAGKQYRLKPIGDAGPVIKAGGIFAYARKTGMIPSEASTLAD